jgi:hypothetical protein
MTGLRRDRRLILLSQSKEGFVRHRQQWGGLGPVFVVGLTLLASLVPVDPAAAAGHEAAKAAPAAAGSRDPAALAVVERMAARLVAAERLAMQGEIAWDVVQPDGRTLEFGATREIVLRRPDRLRVDIALREGGRKRLLYDGAQLVLQDLDQNVYASVARTGSLDDVASYAGKRLGVPVALAELLSPELTTLLTGKIDDASYVGEATIDGERCDHVSLRNEVGGLQLWVGKGDSLPRQVTITYEHEEGRPQFRARFSDWDLSPKASDGVFSFEPPKGAERIAFAPVPASRGPEEAR